MEPAPTSIPATRYTRSGDVRIAYQVVGDGPEDLVLAPGFPSHLEHAWEQPALAYFYRRLASFSRLILFDKRGLGLSEAYRTGWPRPTSTALFLVNSYARRLRADDYPGDRRRTSGVPTRRPSSGAGEGLCSSTCSCPAAPATPGSPTGGPPTSGAAPARERRSRTCG